MIEVEDFGLAAQPAERDIHPPEPEHDEWWAVIWEALRKRYPIADSETIDGTANKILAAIAPLREAHERLKRTVAFMEDTYLEQHGGSWGQCAWKQRATAAEARLAAITRIMENREQ